jgi:hypothetical protein
MAVGEHSHQHPRRRWFAALFGEAFELEHRRRRRYLLLMLLTCAAAAALVLGLRDGGQSGTGSPAGGSRRGVVRVSSTTLPNNDYWSLVAAHGRLLISGGSQGDELVGGRVTGICSAASVDPQTLHVTSIARGNCGNPALFGRRVMPVSYLASNSPPLPELGLRIAIVAPHARDGYRLGPLVLRYPQCSDCGIVSTYGDGSLWVYSPSATPMSNRTGELFRISEVTGRVVQRWRMPSFTRALLAADSDGLWVSQSLYGGSPTHVPSDQRIDYRSIYRVAPGMRSPVRVRALNRSGAYWIVAAGHSLWVDQSDDGRTSHLWKFEGGSATPLISARRLPSGSGCSEMGEGQPSTTGDTQIGIYCIALSESGGNLQGFAPRTGAPRATPIAALRKGAPASYDSGPGPATVLGRSVFFLEKNRLFSAATTS